LRYDIGYRQVFVMLKNLTLLLLLFSCPVCAVAYNYSYEERIAKQLAAGLPESEVLWLRAGGREFISLYRGHNTGQARGAIIILHGMGGHPDWPEIVSPLRSALPALGWATLSIQLPVLSPGDPIADYGRTLGDAKQRLQAAVQQLRDWQFSNIVVIGHSFGAATAAQVLGNPGLKAVKAFVGISMQAPQFLSPRLKLLHHLESISIPVLDIYGSRDTLEVRREADDRRLAARKNDNRAYQQTVVEGADHYFSAVLDVLLKRIQGWLARVVPGTNNGIATNSDTGPGSKQEAKSGE